MLVVFTPIYSVVSSREGFEYKDTMLYPSLDGDTTVYSGKLNGKETSFTVTVDKTVTFQYGDISFGPYSVREDPTAIPAHLDIASQMTGIEIQQEERVFFRGGVFRSGGKSVLVPEDGTGRLTVQGVTYDAQGNIIDRMTPQASAILEVAEGPELTTHGDWKAYFYCVAASVLTVASILYADELFRRKLSWHIQNVHDAEPSDWELFSRYTIWTIMPVTILILYIAGLKT